MTNIAQTDQRQGPFGGIRGKWGWFAALGAAFIILGTIAFLNVIVATVASVYTIGIMMIIAGAAQIAHGFGMRSWAHFLLWLAVGIVYAVAGILAFANPLLASVALTLVLAASLVASGVIRIWIGAAERSRQGWGWVVAAGVITALTGLIIALGWPVNSLYVLGLFLAIDLIFQGWSLFAVAMALRR